jgi:hypothetical protein
MSRPKEKLRLAKGAGVAGDGVVSRFMPQSSMNEDNATYPYTLTISPSEQWCLSLKSSPKPKLLGSPRHGSSLPAGATLSPSMPLRATEAARKPVARISASVALID